MPEPVNVSVVLKSPPVIRGVYAAIYVGGEKAAAQHLRKTGDQFVTTQFEDTKITVTAKPTPGIKTRKWDMVVKRGAKNEVGGVFYTIEVLNAAFS